MSADVDQLTRHRVGPGVHRFTHGLVAAADRGKSQHREHRVEQPASAPAAKLSMGADDHPDRQRQQGGRPHPVEHLVHRGAERHQEKTAQSHEQRRSRRPSLWLVGEPHREHGQHRPAQRESAQDCAGDGALLGRDERGGGEEQGGDESGGQRAGHDPTDASAAPVDREAGSSVTNHLHAARSTSAATFTRAARSSTRCRSWGVNPLFQHRQRRKARCRARVRSVARGCPEFRGTSVAAR